jgi:hypothetical protein
MLRLVRVSLAAVNVGVDAITELERAEGSDRRQ